MRIVMKFGPSSLRDAQGLIRVANIIKGFLEENEVVVVTSALAAIPEDVVATADAARRGKGRAVGYFVRRLKARLRGYARKGMSQESIRRAISWEVMGYCDKVESLLYSVYHTGELTDRTKDKMLALAERISASLVSGLLEDMGVVTAPMAACEAGIVTDSAFGRAQPIEGLVEASVKERLLPPLERGMTPVIAGNATANEEGEPTTLGVGGSDYCASLIGAALPADEVWIWAGVNGIMTADPRIVRNAATIPVLSYAEAAELTFSGVKILHPRTIEPAVEKGIPVVVRSAFNLDNPGTRIVKTPERYEGIVKSLSITKDLAMVAVEGAPMIGVPGTAARVFHAMGREGINILMISQSSSETNISLVIQRSDIDRALAALNAEFGEEGPVRRFFVQDSVCAVAAVGAGMRGTPGVAARIFKAVADQGINVLMIAQGSSELNISFVVSEADGEKAVMAIHDEFRLDRLGAARRELDDRR